LISWDELFWHLIFFNSWIKSKIGHTALSFTLLVFFFFIKKNRSNLLKVLLLYCAGLYSFVKLQITSIEILISCFLRKFLSQSKQIISLSLCSYTCFFYFRRNGHLLLCSIQIKPVCLEKCKREKARKDMFLIINLFHWFDLLDHLKIYFLLTKYIFMHAI